MASYPPSACFCAFASYSIHEPAPLERLHFFSAAAVVGDECVIDVNVDVRRAADDDGRECVVEPVWQRVKILAYNDASGEHEVVDVRDDGMTDPSRAQWLPLFAQRTKPRVKDDDDDDDA